MDDHHDHTATLSSLEDESTTSATRLFKAALHEHILPWAVERAGGESEAKLYYGALSVAVETLALLLFVEACRRKLDDWAINRPIFTAILDCVYRELATLGIVELFIHLLHEYYDNLDVGKEAIFVDVHFVFFYTAIFNAIASTILAIVSHRVSYRIWVRTEELELSHYVEIREEFDRVRQQLYGDHDAAPYNSTSLSVTGGWKQLSDNLQRSTTEFYDTGGRSCWTSLQNLCWGLFYTVKYPRLKAKHDKLLVQVRFHELRVHFLQAYDLPVKLKVSTYLMRSLQAVLKHLIHVSTMAWLWLTGLINVMYYLAGIVVAKTEDEHSSATTLITCFFLAMILFLIFSIIVYRRMQIIFLQIMEMKHLWDFNDNEPATAKQRDGGTHKPNHVDYEEDPATSRRYRDPALASEQLQLFFLNDPKIVIILIQFMQFGYAIAISVVVVYWTQLGEGDFMDAEFYLMITVICYILFVITTAQTLVRFTMATSLGQLVDRKRLHETVAMFRLEEAERRRQQRMEMDMEFYFENTNNNKPGSPMRKAGRGFPVVPTGGQQPYPEQSQMNGHDNKAMMVPPMEPSIEVTLNGGGGKLLQPLPTVREQSETFSVVSETSRNSLPPVTSAAATAADPTKSPMLSGGTQLTEEPKAGATPDLSSSKRSSAIVAGDPLRGEVGLTPAAPPAAAVAESPRPAAVPKATPPPPPKLKGLAAIPEKQATLQEEKATQLFDLVKMDTSSLRQAVPLEEIRLAERRDRRRNRRKSVSDGVALMSAIGKVGQNVGTKIGETVPFFGAGDSEKTNSRPVQGPPLRKQSTTGDIPRPKAKLDPNAPKFPVDDTVINRRKERRRNWKKNLSESAAIQQMRDFSAPTAEEQKKPEDSIWNTNSKSKVDLSNASPVATPNLFAASPVGKKTASDDSATAIIANTQRRERRRNRKKALSASAAVKLMRNGSDDDDEIKKEQESMMQFWTGTVHEDENEDEGDGDGNDNKNKAHNSSLSSLQQSERLLQNTSFLASLPNEHQEPQTQAMVMPMPKPMPMPTLREVSAAREESSGALDLSHAESDDRERSLDMNHSDTPANEGEVTAALTASALQSLPTDEKVLSASLEGKGSWVFENNDDGDDSTVETDRSVGGLSHVGSVNDAVTETIRTIHGTYPEDDAPTPMAKRIAEFNEKIKLFFLSKRYSKMSHLFGTMICFFLLGMRIEGFLKEQCIIPDEDYTWEFRLPSSFWLIIACFLVFIVGALWKSLLFPACKPELEDSEEDDATSVDSKKERWMMFLAAMFDLLVCVTCLLVFLGAEIARCCDGSEYPNYDAYDSGYPQDEYESADEGEHYEPEDYPHRILAGGSDSSYESETEICLDTTIYCNCPKFGTRVEGGLGRIEPWAAFVVLRVFRFILARNIVERFDLGRDELEQLKQGEAEHRSAHMTTTAANHGVDNMQNGTVVELWQAAISQYPDIVDKYGEFSGELLQAMLGVEITHQTAAKPTPGQNPGEAQTTPLGSESATSGLRRSASSTGDVAGSGLRRSLPSTGDLAGNEHITLEGKKYCKLAPEVQEIIVAGKLGCPVKSCGNLQGLMPREPSAPNLAELGNQEVVEGPVEFEVDVAQMALDRYENTSSFEFPNARLVRSMRRCERKLLPLLDEWSSVDVVLTSHEIVYVHTDDPAATEDDRQLREAGRQALVATKGGKGLRLCDVTSGRHVVGQLSFADIVSVHVERIHRKEGSVTRSAIEVTEELNHGHVEFWQDMPEDDRGESPVDRQKRWDSVHQDSLKLETIHGTLYLRFFSDLEDSESHPERVVAELDEEQPVYKNISLQWAQTIVRQLCMAKQLKQNIAHVGTCGNDELLDLLQIVPRDEKQGHRRKPSASALLGGGKTYRTNRPPPRGRRTRSEVPTLSGEDLKTGEPGVANGDDHPLRKMTATSAGGAQVPRIPRPRKFTRFASYDEGDGRASQNDEGNKKKDDDDRAVSIA